MIQIIDVSAIDCPEFVPLANLIESIQKFGIVEPLVITMIDNRPKIVDGMARLNAARKLGIVTVPCVIVAMTDGQVQEYREINDR